MDADFANEYLASNLKWDDEPTLSVDEKNRLMEIARAVDVNGISPDGDDYEDTYTYDSLASAIAVGCGWKAAAAAELHEGDENVIYDHWKQEESKWLGRVSSSSIGGPVSSASGGSFAIANQAVW